MIASNNDRTMVGNGLTRAQQAFLDYCKEIGWGTLEEVVVKNGEPVYVKRAIEGKDLTK